MFSQTLTIAKNTFLESVRQPIFFILIGICAFFQLITVWGTAYSMNLTDSGEVTGDTKLAFDIGMATVFVCGLLLAAFNATSVISREIENKTVLTVVSKPVSRVRVVLGKYVGSAAAMLVAILTMLLFLHMGVRHQVMSTAADTLDGPVVIFSLLAIFGAIGTAVWGNFFYGWNFVQTSALLLMPFMAVAYILVLLLSKKWEIQPITTDFKPQIAMVSLCLIMAQLVFTAMATAASARLGQVMTIVVCTGLFLAGMLSNYFLGRHAFDNRLVAVLKTAEPDALNETPFVDPGDTYHLVFEYEPEIPIDVGSQLYYGPNPNGFDLKVPEYPRFVGDTANPEELSDREKPGSLVVTASKAMNVTLVNAGAAVPISRPPQPGDYIFLRPTRVNFAALGAWGIVPNVQFFWLSDAITQNQPIPWSHVGLVYAYGLIQITLFLALAVCLFQTREVG